MITSCCAEGLFLFFLLFSATGINYSFDFCLGLRAKKNNAESRNVLYYCEPLLVVLYLLLFYVHSVTLKLRLFGERKIRIAFYHFKVCQFK